MTRIVCTIPPYFSIIQCLPIDLAKIPLLVFIIEYGIKQIVHLNRFQPRKEVPVHGKTLFTFVGGALFFAAIVGILHPWKRAAAPSTPASLAAVASQQPCFEIVSDNGAGSATLLVRGRTLAKGMDLCAFSKWLEECWEKQNAGKVFLKVTACKSRPADAPLQMTLSYTSASLMPVGYEVGQYLPSSKIPEVLADGESVLEYEYLYTLNDGKPIVLPEDA